MRTDVTFLGNGLALTGNLHAPEHGRHIRAADRGGAAGLEGRVHLSSALSLRLVLR